MPDESASMKDSTHCATPPPQLWVTCRVTDFSPAWKSSRAPVALRFRTYGVDCPAPAQGYVDTVVADPDGAEWIRAGCEETEVVEADEAGI